ncbi:MAG: hypothetical protein AVDCRST_MAG80-2283, partial [uncultured Rubrobacteraceae bacterium]
GTDSGRCGGRRVRFRTRRVWWIRHAGHRGPDARASSTDLARRRGTGRQYYRDGRVWRPERTHRLRPRPGRCRAVAAGDAGGRPELPTGGRLRQEAKEKEAQV